MKYIYITVLVLLTSIAHSQENVHWLINQDKNTDCNFIRSGKFVNEGVGGVITEGYTIEFRGNTVIEQIEGGKYYLKSRITYTSKCSYELKVLETTIPGYEEVVGKIFYTEILETAKIDNLVKIRSKGEDWQVLVLKKIEE